MLQIYACMFSQFGSHIFNSIAYFNVLYYKKIDEMTKTVLMDILHKVAI